MRTRPDRRGAFTLIELIVVIVITAFLTALTAVLISALAPSFKTSSGADLVAGRLLSARQMAKRDGVPTGVRFLMDPNDPTICTEMVFIRQPDDVAQGLYMGWAQPPTPTNTPPATPTVARIRVPAGAPFPVGAGDYLELYNGGVVRRITGVTADPNQPGDYLVSVNGSSGTGVDLPDVSANPPVPGVSQTNYRITPQPQPISQETSLVLPAGVMIDFSIPKDSSGNPTWWASPLSTPPPSPTAPPHTEILFSPTGAVVGQGTTGMIYVWVRRGAIKPATGAIDPPNNVDHLAGSPRIVTVYVKSGTVAQHPVSRKSDPYEFTRDGRASGM